MQRIVSSEYLHFFLISLSCNYISLVMTEGGYRDSIARCTACLHFPLSPVGRESSSPPLQPLCFLGVYQAHISPFHSPGACMPTLVSIKHSLSPSHSPGAYVCLPWCLSSTAFPPSHFSSFSLCMPTLVGGLQPFSPHASTTSCDSKTVSGHNIWVSVK